MKCIRKLLMPLLSPLLTLLVYHPDMSGRFHVEILPSSTVGAAAAPAAPCACHSREARKRAVAANPEPAAASDHEHQLATATPLAWWTHSTAQEVCSKSGRFLSSHIKCIWGDHNGGKKHQTFQGSGHKSFSVGTMLLILLLTSVTMRSIDSVDTRSCTLKSSINHCYQPKKEPPPFVRPPGSRFLKKLLQAHSTSHGPRLRQQQRFCGPERKPQANALSHYFFRGKDPSSLWLLYSISINLICIKEAFCWAYRNCLQIPLYVNRRRRWLTLQDER